MPVEDGSSNGAEQQGLPANAAFQVAANQNPPSTPVDKNSGDQTAKELKEIKRGERYLIWIGILTLIVNCSIAFIYWQELIEMVGVAGQTDALTRSYRSQARDISTLAKETHEIAVQSLTQSQQTTKIATDTHELAVQAGIQSRATRNVAINMQGQLDTMKMQVELAERPRISIRVNSEGPLTFVKDYSGKDKVRVPLTITYHNSGPTPALVIVQFRKLATDVYAYMAGNKNQEGQQKSVRDVCLENTDLYKTSDEILPGTDESGPAIVEGTINPAFITQINPMLTACISYRSSFGKKVYHSEIGYSISTKDGALPFGLTVPESDLRIQEIGGSKHADDDEK